jgi:hypothetical protein
LEATIGTQDIILQSVLVNGVATAQMDPLSTPTDRDILTKVAKIQLSNINTQNTQPDLGGFAFATVQPLPDSGVSVGLGNREQKTLDQMVAARTESTNNAASALRTVEIIMGEYTGLGLCDIIAIFTALWTVDIGVLINMLDDEAFARLYAIVSLRSPEVEARHSNNNRTLSAQTVLQMFENQVKLMYNVMDKLLTDRIVYNIK